MSNGPAGSGNARAKAVVRDSTIEDMEAVHQIYSDAVTTGTASFEVEPPGLDELLRRRAAVLAYPCPYLVATIAGAVAGYAYAGSYRTRHAYRFTVENTVYVAPHAGRCGVGTALMEELIARCAGLGYAQMIAVIGGDNPASVALHLRAGFRHAGVLHQVGHKFGDWLDSTLMQRALQPTLGEGLIPLSQRIDL